MPLAPGEMTDLRIFPHPGLVGVLAFQIFVGSEQLPILGMSYGVNAEL